MTNEELKQLSDETFFDNDTGEIQPAGHRNFNNHLIDHTDTLCEATLRNSKEYTDARETAILAAADTKDADTLKTAKAYADKIVAALAGSAPETLDTLQELAAALGDDPNFSATVMQMIGERVTVDALAEALAGKADKNGNSSEDWDANIVRASGGIRVPEMTGISFEGDNVDQDLHTPGYGIFTANPTKSGLDTHGDVTSDYVAYLTMGGYNEATNNHRGWIFRNPSIKKNVASVSNSGVGTFAGLKIGDKEVWHSGNAAVNLDTATDLRDCNDMTENGRHYYCTMDNVATKIANRPSDLSFGLITMGSANKTQIAADYANNWYVRAKHWEKGWSSWVRLLLAGDVKRTYHAQIDAGGQIIRKSADWIKSVDVPVDDRGYYFKIVPKIQVDMSSVQVTRVSVGWNDTDGSVPMVYDTLVDGAIRVFFIPTSGYRPGHVFNISVQEA